MGSGRRLPEDPLLHGGNRRLAELVSRRLLAHHRHVAALPRRRLPGRPLDRRGLPGLPPGGLGLGGAAGLGRHRHERQIAAVGRIGNGQQARASARIAVTAFIVYPSVAINARTAPLATKVRKYEGRLSGALRDD